jgi:acetyl-CoA carboxylase carboxyltransferase component
VYADHLPSAGIITGIGRINGILCVLVANDPVVKVLIFSMKFVISRAARTTP